MAETVKKSRIVSEDDLEESLMQEFNMRLKHCMGQVCICDFILFFLLFFDIIINCY